MAKGRLSVDEQQQIIDGILKDLTAEELAAKLGRTLKSIQAFIDKLKESLVDTGAVTEEKIEQLKVETTQPTKPKDDTRFVLTPVDSQNVDSTPRAVQVNSPNVYKIR